MGRLSRLRIKDQSVSIDQQQNRIHRQAGIMNNLNITNIIRDACFTALPTLFIYSCKVSEPNNNNASFFMSGFLPSDIEIKVCTYQSNFPTRNLLYQNIASFQFAVHDFLVS